MENDPKALRQEQSAPLLSSDAQIEYYDTKALDWLPKEGKLRAAAETIFPYAQKAFRTMDWLGGKFANGLGLTSSRFQYAVDEYDRRERRHNEREARERQKERDLARQAGIIDDDDSRMPYVPPVQLSFIQQQDERKETQQPKKNNDKKKSSTNNNDDDDDEDETVKNEL